MFETRYLTPMLTSYPGSSISLGGVLLLVEGELQVYSSQKVPIDPAFGPNDPGASWMAQIIFGMFIFEPPDHLSSGYIRSESYNAFKSRGSSIDAGIQLHSWLVANPLFEQEEYSRLFCPIGPWETGATPAETERLRTIGEWMRANSKVLINGLHVERCALKVLYFRISSGR
jgi:hypothetical protein